MFLGGRLHVVTQRGGNVFTRWHFLLATTDGLVYDFTYIHDEDGTRGRDSGIFFEGWVRVRSRLWWLERGTLIPA